MLGREQRHVSQLVGSSVGDTERPPLSLFSSLKSSLIRDIGSENWTRKKESGFPTRMSYVNHLYCLQDKSHPSGAHTWNCFSDQCPRFPQSLKFPVAWSCRPHTGKNTNIPMYASSPFGQQPVCEFWENHAPPLGLFPPLCQMGNLEHVVFSLPRFVSVWQLYLSRLMKAYHRCASQGTWPLKEKTAEDM